jgi:hypothetical protein
MLRNLLRKLGLKVIAYETLTYHKSVFEIYEVFNYLIGILKNNSTQGSFVELGFGQGRSFSVLSHFAVNEKRKIFGLDSFIGFPKVLDLDSSIRNPKVGEWSVRNLPEAKKQIKNLYIFKNEQDFNLIQIVFDKSALNPIPNETIAFLHIDLDLYEGYKYSLEMFWDQIAARGIVLFDEYDLIKWPGATKAINEFVALLPPNSFSFNKFRGKHYIIKH